MRYTFSLLICLFLFSDCTNSEQLNNGIALNNLKFSKKGQDLIRFAERVEYSNVEKIRYYGTQLFHLKGDTNANILGEYYLLMAQCHTTRSMQSVINLLKFKASLKGNDFDFLHFKIDLYFENIVKMQREFRLLALDADLNFPSSSKSNYILERTAIMSFIEKYVSNDSPESQVERLLKRIKLLPKANWTIYHSIIYELLATSYFQLHKKEESKKLYKMLIRLNFKNHYYFEAIRVLENYVLNFSDPIEGQKLTLLMIDLAKKMHYKCEVSELYKLHGHFLFNNKQFKEANEFYKISERVGIQDSTANFTELVARKAYVAYSLFKQNPEGNYKRAMFMLDSMLKTFKLVHFTEKRMIYQRKLYIDQELGKNENIEFYKNQIHELMEIVNLYYVNFRVLYYESRSRMTQKDLAIIDLEKKESLNDELILKQKLLLIMGIIILGLLIWIAIFFRQKLSIQQQLNVNNKIIEKQNVELNTLIFKLKDSNENLENFAQIAAHDLKSPLVSIKWLVDLLKPKVALKINAEEMEILDSMKKSCVDLIDSITSLLQFSMITKNLPNSTEFNFERIVSNVRESLFIVFVEQQVQLKVPQKLPEISGHISLITQLCLNIISNAIKFHKDGIPVVISIDFEDYSEEFYKFSISDNGIGINKKHLKSVFEIFNKLHSTDEYEGSGIGLATCKKIAVYYGGKIWMTSTIDVGTTVFFLLKKPSSNDEALERN